MKEDAYWIIEQVKEHNKWFEECIPMIASENLMSPLAKEMMISDFHDRYAEGMPGKRYYRGNIYVTRSRSGAWSWPSGYSNASSPTSARSPAPWPTWPPCSL